MDIVQERLEREYDMALRDHRAPPSSTRFQLRDGAVNASSRTRRRWRIPRKSKRSAGRIIETVIFVPQEYVGAIMTLCTQKRGVQKNMQYHGRPGGC